MREYSIKPIETKYNGVTFRSRLEARWAVYFDKIGLQYVYEMEGFDLGVHGLYLPDFWLPQVDMWAEVKATKFTNTEIDKCFALYDSTGQKVLFLVGVPDLKAYKATAYRDEYRYDGSFDEEGTDTRRGCIDFLISKCYAVLHERRLFQDCGCTSRGHEPEEVDYYPDSEYQYMLEAQRYKFR